jgi:antitoxin VapB
LLGKIDCYILAPYTSSLWINIMSISTVFTNNRTQAVRLPADVRLPDDVKQVRVRAKGKERIIAPLESSWDSFFTGEVQATDDFMSTRATQTQTEREAL